MFLHKAKKPTETQTWLRNLDFSIISIEDIIAALTEERIAELFKMLQNVKDKDSPLFLSAAKVVSRIAYPIEYIPFIRQKILEDGIVPVLLHFGETGYIRAHNIIKKSELEFGEEVAKGSGGQVYKGKWNDKDVAIKVCGKQHTFFACVEGFRFETTVMSLLEHPNIMKCYGANEKASEPFIVMPLCQFGNLTQLLANPPKRLSLALKIHIAIQLADAMAHMHKCGLLHRDLKPGNVLVDSKMNVFLIDFGISRVYEAKRPMTMNVGTTAYIAPEIFSGNGVYTNAVDVFSFSIILWEILTEQKPYKAIGLRSFDIPLEVVNGVRPGIPDNVPDSIIQLMEQCWHENPKKRPSFEKIKTRLEEIQPEALWYGCQTSEASKRAANEPPLSPKRNTVAVSGSQTNSISSLRGNSDPALAGGLNEEPEVEEDKDENIAPNSVERVEDEEEEAEEDNIETTNSPQTSLSLSPATVPKKRSSAQDVRAQFQPTRPSTSALGLKANRGHRSPLGARKSPAIGRRVPPKPTRSPKGFRRLPRPKTRELAMPPGIKHSFTQYVTVKITSITVINNDLYWIGLQSGEICVITSSNLNKSVPCDIIHQFFAHKQAVTSLVTVGDCVWSVSLTGSTKCWKISDYSLEWEHPSDNALCIAKIIQIGKEVRIWTTGSSEEDDCALCVWDPSDCLKVSKVIVVPPKNCTEKLVVSSIVQFGEFVLLGTNQWIYIFHALSLKALSYWKAHENYVSGLCVLGGKIWSFAENSHTIKLWSLDIQNGSMTSIKQIPLQNSYSGANISLIKRVHTDVWCFYQDGKLALVTDTIKQKFCGSWLGGDSIVTHIEQNQNRIVVCTDRLILGLEATIQN